MKVTSIAEQLLFTTVRVDTVDPSGVPGSGTAFFFLHAIGDKSYPFIVTNKHVVFGATKGSLTFLKGKDQSPLLGQHFRLGIDDWSNAWFGHPSGDVDIAICPFAPILEHINHQYGVDLFYRFITSDLIPSQEKMDELDALEQITFIGYPNGIWDNKNFLPVARRGMTATPISVDFDGRPHFLIDASVFGGSSGSPVFLFNQGMFTEKSGSTILSSRLLFLGVVFAVFYRTQLNQIISVSVPTQVQSMAQQQEMIDLGIVLKASTVVETVEAWANARSAA